MANGQKLKAKKCMAKEATKSFVLRVDADMMEAIEKWAADEFRSTNGHVGAALCTVSPPRLDNQMSPGIARGPLGEKSPAPQPRVSQHQKTYRCSQVFHIKVGKGRHAF